MTPAEEIIQAIPVYAEAVRAANDPGQCDLVEHRKRHHQGHEPGDTPAVRIQKMQDFQGVEGMARKLDLLGKALAMGLPVNGPFDVSDEFIQWVWNGYRLVYPDDPNRVAIVPEQEWLAWRRQATPIIDRLKRVPPTANQADDGKGTDVPPGQIADQFPPMTFVDFDGRIYRFESKMLWQLWKAIFTSKFPVSHDQLRDGRVEQWGADSISGESAIPNAVKELRAFWRKQSPNREDLATRIKTTGTDNVFFEKT